MNNTELKEIADSIVNEVKKLAKGEWTGRSEEIGAVASSYLTSSQANLKQWTEDLASSKISPAEFKLLVNDQAALIKLAALSQAGKSAIAIDKLRQGILDIVVKVVLERVL
jgi:hypothetical protein